MISKCKYIFLFCLLTISFLCAENKKIVILEGLEGTGKSTLTNKLSFLLKERATHYAHSLQSDADLTAIIAKDDHEIILLDSSWLSEEAAVYASGKSNLQDWPKSLYFPTHLFVLTLSEETRQQRLHYKKNADLQLIDNANYHAKYLEAYHLMMERLKWNTLCLQLDRNLLSLEEMAQHIISLLDVDLSLLDPRQMTTSDKQEVRPYYLSWKAHLTTPIINSSEHLVIVPNANKAPSLVQEGCQFENIDQPFDYAQFSKERHPPVSIGFLEKKKTFDFPFTDEVWQIQDMPIAFPTDRIEDYVYRLPKCLEAFKEFVQKTADTWQKLSTHPQKYYAYLTISYDIVPPFKTQRRPCIHCDGFKSARIKSEELGQYAFVVTNAFPTVYYIEPFDVSDLDPAKDDFFVAFSKRTSKKPLECQSPYEIMMLDPYTLHAARPNLTLFPVQRTFARILFSTRIFDRIGNAHNPAFDYTWEMVPRDAQAQFVTPKGTREKM